MIEEYVVRLYHTDILFFTSYDYSDQVYLTLSDGGYPTQLTKDWMNKFLLPLGMKVVKNCDELVLKRNSSNYSIGLHPTIKIEYLMPDMPEQEKFNQTI